MVLAVVLNMALPCRLEVFTGEAIILMCGDAGASVLAAHVHLGAGQCNKAVQLRGCLSDIGN